MSFNIKNNKTIVQIIKGIPLALLFHIMASCTWTFGIYIGYALSKANYFFVPPSFGVIDTWWPDLHNNPYFYYLVYNGMFNIYWVSVPLFIYFRYGKQNFYQFLKLVMIVCLINAIVYVVHPFYCDKLVEDGRFKITAFAALPSVHTSNCYLGLIGVVMGLKNNKQRKMNWLDVLGIVVVSLFAVGVIPIIMLAHAHYIIDTMVSIVICATLFIFWFFVTHKKHQKLSAISKLQSALDISFASKFHLDNNKTQITKKDIFLWILLYFILICIYVILIVLVLVAGMNLYVTI